MLKSLKMLGSGVVIAVATIPIGSSYALAAEHKGIGLCPKNEPILCASPLTVPSSGAIRLVLKAIKPTLEGFPLGQKCGFIRLAIKMVEADKNPLGAEIAELTKEENCEPCKKSTAVGLPYSVSISMPVEDKGDFTLVTDILMSIQECPMGIKCKFGAKSVNLLGENTEEGLVFKAEEDTLILEEGNSLFCGSADKISANFESSEVKLTNSKDESFETHPDVWLSLLPLT